MSEQQIERRVEAAMDRLDRQLMRHEIDSDTYNAEIERLTQWAEEQYRSN